jgi:SulP family sulfate permease
MRREKVMITSRAIEPTFVQLFTPKLITVLRERYGWQDLRADVLSGLTVAIVALPLSMAIAIASGVTPDRGLTTAIVGGFVVSLLGGSRFQIGGPAGAFIVLVAATVRLHGVEGLLLATIIAGLVLLAAGLLRFGTFIKYIPYPVTVGFTAGIAVIIFASQMKDLFGLTLAGAEPGELLPKLWSLAAAWPTISPSAVLLSSLAIGAIVILRIWRPHWPGLLIAVGLVTIVAWAWNLPVETIGTRFGGIPRGLPAPHLPVITLDKLIAVLPSALSFALLGSIESLLSAVVADSMTGRRHRSNCELVAQGAANILSALFGGICVTGTIARTATNVRSGARGPLSGMLHSAFLLLFMLLAAPLASYIPLAALAGVLTTVAWNMAERHAFVTLLQTSRGEALVVLATFLLTIFRDLTEGILVGFALSSLLFIHRMAQTVEVQIEADQSDLGADGERVPYDPAMATNPDVVVYRISGAFFFAAATSVTAALERIAEHPKAYVIDVSGVPHLDSSAASALEGFTRKVARKGLCIYVAGARAPVRRMLLRHGVKQPQVRFMANVSAAVAQAHANIRAASPLAKPEVSVARSE